MSESRAYVATSVPLLRDGLTAIARRSGFTVVDDVAECDVVLRCDPQSFDSLKSDVLIDDRQMIIRVHLNSPSATRTRLARLIEQLLSDDAMNVTTAGPTPRPY